MFCAMPSLISTGRHPADPMSGPILHPKKTQALWSRARSQGYPRGAGTAVVVVAIEATCHGGFMYRCFRADIIYVLLTLDTKTFPEKKDLDLGIVHIKTPLVQL